MSRLTSEQLSIVASCGVLATFASGALADFERQTLAEVSERVILLGYDAVITDPEWRVINDVHRALSNCAVAMHTLRYEDSGRGPMMVRQGGRA